MTEKRNINYYAVDGLIMQGEHVDVNVPIKIALDHGWSSIKGEHIFMENLVTQVDYTPLTNNGLLEYRGRKYIIGQGRLGKQATKTENDNYFLLTLAGYHLRCLVQREKPFVNIYGTRNSFPLNLRVCIIVFI